VERQRLLQNIPAHRYGTVTDIAAVVLFLLIGESRTPGIENREPL